MHAATRDLTHPDYVDIDRGLFALHPCEPRLNVQGSEYVPVSGLSLGLKMSTRGRYNIHFVPQLNSLSFPSLAHFFEQKIVPYNDDSNFGPRLIY